MRLPWQFSAGVALVVFLGGVAMQLFGPSAPV
jgi:restriction system protein